MEAGLGLLTSCPQRLLLGNRMVNLWMSGPQASCYTFCSRARCPSWAPRIVYMTPFVRSVDGRWKLGYKTYLYFSGKVVPEHCKMAIYQVVLKVHYNKSTLKKDLDGQPLVGWESTASPAHMKPPRLPNSRKLYK